MSIHIPRLMFEIWMWGVPIWALCALGYLLVSVIRSARHYKKEEEPDSASAD